ncbi:MAG: type II secretion system protein [Phycisphaerales bacterium]
MLQAVHTVLRERPTSDWLSAVERVLSGIRPTPLSPLLDRERLYAGEMLARHFSEAKRVRQGLNAPEFDSTGDYGIVRSILGQELDEDRMRLGRYAENRSALIAVYASFGPESDLDPFERSKGRSDPGQSDLVMIDLLTPSLQQCLRTRDRSELRHRAVRTMLELERYRLDHGEYPDTLPAAALSPVLRDPFSGRRFGYRRAESDNDGSGRGYVLWTVGLDGVDNGGAFDEDSWDQALMPWGFGKDMMLNSPRWW